MDELMKSYPAGLKEAFNIASLDSVEAYVDAEMLSLIVPLAIAFLAVRCAAARDRRRAEERGYLDTAARRARSRAARSSPAPSSSPRSSSPRSSRS